MPENASSESVTSSPSPRGMRWSIVLIAFWLVAAAFFLRFCPEKFEATALFQVPNASKDSETELKTIAEKMRRYPLHKTVFDKNGGFASVENFQKHTSVRVLPRTGLIRLTVSAATAADAEKLATQLFDAFQKRESEQQSVATNNYRPARMLLVDPVYVRGPLKPSLLMVFGIALGCGIASATALVWIRDCCRNRD